MRPLRPACSQVSAGELLVSRSRRLRADGEANRPRFVLSPPFAEGHAPGAHPHGVHYQLAEA
jgi:hypothetical protein